MSWVYLSLICMVLTVGHNLLEKWILTKCTVIQYLSVFYIFNTLLTLPFIGQINFNLSLREYILTAIVAIISLASIFFSKSALRHFEISYVKPLESIGPLIILFFAFLFLHEAISFRQTIGTSLVIISCFLIIGIETNALKRPLKNLITARESKYIWVALLIGGISAILDRIILKTVPALTYLFLCRFFLMAGFLAIIFLKYKGVNDIKEGLKNEGKIIFSLAVINFGVVYSYNLALAHPQGQVGVVAAIIYSSTLFTILFSGRLFHEKKIFHKLLLGVILFCGLYFLIA